VRHPESVRKSSRRVAVGGTKVTAADDDVGGTSDGGMGYGTQYRAETHALKRATLAKAEERRATPDTDTTRTRAQGQGPGRA